MKNTFWTDEEDEILIERTRRLVPVIEIAAELDRGMEAVKLRRSVLRNRGVELPSTKLLHGEKQARAKRKKLKENGEMCPDCEIILEGAPPCHVKGCWQDCVCKKEHITERTIAGVSWEAA